MYQRRGLEGMADSLEPNNAAIADLLAEVQGTKR